MQTDRRAVFTFLLLCTDYYFWWRSKWTVKFSYPTRLNVEGLFLNPTFCSESRLLNWCSSLRLVAHAIWIPLNSYSLPFVGSWWCVFVFYKKKKRVRWNYRHCSSSVSNFLGNNCVPNVDKSWLLTCALVIQISTMLTLNKRKVLRVDKWRKLFFPVIIWRIYRFYFA